MKQIKNISFFVFLVAYLIMVTGFISTREKKGKINSLMIRIADSTENRFIHTADIRNMLEQRKYNMYGKPSGMVNLEEIEEALKSKQIISEAEVYITEPGVLHVDVSQKSPFVRINNRMGQGYYLDNRGNVIPLSHNFSPYVVVANGYISEPFRVGQTLNIFNVKHDSLPASQKTIYDVYNLVRFLSNDNFWNAQIEQIYINNRYEVELIPRVGSHIIELGRVENLREKFNNLEVLYRRGFSKTGWNQYERISLKYKNQVVCTKIQ